MGSASTLPGRRLKRVAICPDDLAGAVKPAGTEDSGDRHHDAIQIEVVELTKPSGKDERSGSDNHHRDPRSIKEEVVKFTIHGVSPFRVCGTPIVPLVDI